MIANGVSMDVLDNSHILVRLVPQVNFVFSRVLRDSKTRFVGPSVGPSVGE